MVLLQTIKNLGNLSPRYLATLLVLTIVGTYYFKKNKIERRLKWQINQEKKKSKD